MIEQIYKTSITETITEAEKRSNAEFICVLSNEAIDYAPLSWSVAATLAFITGAVLMFFPQIGKITAFEIVVLVFLLFKFLFYKFPKFLEFMLPKMMKFRLTYDFAFSKFELFGYDKCDDTVMFCVCVNEKIAHIICGKNIAEVIPNSEFLDIINEFCQNVNSKNLGQVLQNSVKNLCELVVAKVAKTADDKDDIKEKFVEIK